MVFEKYTKLVSGTRTPLSPRGNLGKSQLTLSSGALALLPAECSYVDMLFDKEDNIIGIQPVTEDVSNALKLIKSSTTQTAAISIGGFRNQFDIKIVGTFCAVWDSGYNMLFINLNNPVRKLRGWS